MLILRMKPWIQRVRTLPTFCRAQWGVTDDKIFSPPETGNDSFLFFFYKKTLFSSESSRFKGGYQGIKIEVLPGRNLVNTV